MHLRVTAFVAGIILAIQRHSHNNVKLTETSPEPDATGSWSVTPPTRHTAHQVEIASIKYACSKIKSRCNPNFLSTSLSLLLLLSGDISTNPGPRTTKYPCGVCKKAVKWGQDAIRCDGCETWYHIDCMSMNPQVYNILANHCNISWICCQCGLSSSPHPSSTLLP